MFSSRAQINELPAFADRVDELGFDELWLAEDCFSHGGISAAAVALTRMSRCSVGIGLLPVALRNPALTAMEVATLAQLYSGRVRVALGHGVDAWMRQVGARRPDRIAHLRDVSDVLIRLLRGEVVTCHNTVDLDGVRLDQVPDVAPDWLLGTTGPRGIALASELEIGLLMPEGSGVEALRWARQQLAPTSSLTVYSWLSIASDQESARTALVPTVRGWRTWNLYPHLTSLAGLPEPDLIDAAMVAGLAVVGTPEQCANQLISLREAGVQTVVFQPVGGDPLSSLTYFSEEVFPLLRS